MASAGTIYRMNEVITKMVGFYDLKNPTFYLYKLTVLKIE